MRFRNLAEKAGMYSLVGGCLVWAGVQSQRIDELIGKSHMAEKREDEHSKLLYEIHGKVCKIETDIKNLFRNMK